MRRQLGAVIVQRDKPLVFWSKTCNAAQRAYPANKLELLSILLVLREYRSLLISPHRRNPAQWIGQEFAFQTSTPQAVPEAPMSDGSTMAAAPDTFDIFSLRLRTNNTTTQPAAQPTPSLRGSGSHGPRGQNHREGLCPSALQQDVLRTYHEWLMHPGGATLARTVQAAFCWPKLETQARQLCDECCTCMTAKYDNKQ
ncbi:TPA: LOW QUALITY PROTEIN: hypothetical protein N0F65_011768 [Lagenidium giganteum]|uniref:Integrase zinc-binding domain-containing protein n=1 Tax=Lagenidium giganteum TaxID=4803 RepID=A0AAV2YSN7_9STRA|nr:TPA: LOW QUALITY PROTEIN: hypothetical protein N0F65_011768 [Lagenidium giganteum]